MKKLCSTRVCPENAYGMLKEGWRIIYKKYVIKVVVLLHNVCIHRKDPCKPRKILSLNDIELIDAESDRTQHKNFQNKSIEITHKTSYLLWKQKVLLYCIYL